MRKICLLPLIATLFFTLAACGKSESAQAVDDMISSLEVVDETSKTAIEEVEAAYNALSDKDKETLENYALLEEARSTFDQLMAEKAITAIDWIGYVTENSWDDIQNARQIYDTLTDAQQELVSNYSDLSSAEEQFIRVKISPIEELIAQIPSFDPSGDTLPDGFIDAVESANEAYEELDEEWKAKVSNHSDLVSATTYLSDYRVNSLIAYIDENFSKIDFNSGTALTVATTAYNLLSDADKARITNYDVLEAAQEEFDNLSPIQLNGYTLGKNIIGQPTINISATNITDSIIKEFRMTIFAYDLDGVPVKVDTLSIGDGFSDNLLYSDALKPGATTKSNGYWQLYGDYGEMKQFIAIVNSVEFFDGTAWQNSQYSTLYNKYNGKILTSDDKNILPQA